MAPVIDNGSWDLAPRDTDRRLGVRIREPAEILLLVYLPLPTPEKVFRCFCLGSRSAGRLKSKLIWSRLSEEPSDARRKS
jgi:hypothetical protein